MFSYPTIIIYQLVIFWGIIIWIVTIYLVCKFFPKDSASILQKINLKKINALREKIGSNLKEIKPFEAILFAAIAIIFPYILFLSFALASTAADSEELYKIGGALQGVSAPFSAGMAAILTFIAFWTQYSANKIMINDNHKQEAIRRFYEMLNIHKDNVSGIKYKVYDPQSFLTKTCTSVANTPSIDKGGRGVFKFFDAEITYLYKFILIVDAIQPNSEFELKKNAFVSAYNIFYKGKYRNFSERLLLTEISNAIYSIDEKHKYNDKIAEEIEKQTYDRRTKILLIKLFRRFWEQKLFCGKQPPFLGYFGTLNHYYRHLYLTVKLVVDNPILPFKTKRDLLRILRAQLTYKEQLLLFYNWLSGNGKQWEAMKECAQKPNAVLNNYFTRYRMIHNILPGDVVFFASMNLDEKNQAKKFIQLFKDVCIEEDLPPKMCNKKEFDSENDVIFQFEDWYPKGTLGFTYPNENNYSQEKTSEE